MSTAAAVQSSTTANQTGEFSKTTKFARTQPIATANGTANGHAAATSQPQSSALQVNPSIMTRDHHGFVTTSKLPSQTDLSLRRHQLGVYSRIEPRSHLHEPYETTYERYHKLKYSPQYATMQNHQADQPSGATHNNVATSIIPKDTTRLSDQPRGDGERRLVDPTDPTVPQPEGSVPTKLLNHMGEDAEPYPFASDYKSTFTDPNLRTLDGRDARAPPKYERNFKTATHAVSPPYLSDNATQEEFERFSGSGYTTNNGFAYDTSRLSRAPPVSHYKQTFLGPRPVEVPVLTDGTVQQPNWKQSNGYLKNGDTMPSIHAVNEGATPWIPRDYESHSKSVERLASEAPRPERVPTRSIQRPGSVASNQTRRRRIEHTAFSRSERGPPCDGIGSEHLKLMLGTYGTSDNKGLHHLSTRPHTAGYEPAHANYHAAHTHLVAPIAPRVGSGIEESQQLATLKKLRTSAPSDYYYELADAPRYRSTYSLLHTNKWEEKSQDREPTGLRSGWIESGGNEPTIENGGVRDSYETSYQRATEEVTKEAAHIRAKGKSVAKPQETGYTWNEHPQEQLLQHASYSARDPQSRYLLTSHLAHQHPSKHAQDLPPARGYQINTLAPVQSSYSREHMPEGYIFPQPVYNTITTLNGRTVVVKKQYTDLHPTVIKSLKVKEPSESMNWARQDHPLVEL